MQVGLAACAALLALGCPGAPAMPSPVAPLGNAMDTGAALRDWLDAGRTPALVLDYARAHSPGFTVVNVYATTQQRLQPGQRLLFVNRDRSAVFVVVGRDPIATDGLRLIGSHIDTPSPRLDTSALTRDNQTEIPLLRYGGMRHHHWPGTPVAVVGRIVRAGGAAVNVALGLTDDFGFRIEEKGNELVLITSSTPTALPGGKDDAPAPRTFVDLLHQRYGVTAADLETAELYAVPRAGARDVGVDRALVGGHGQDDRVNSFAAWRAVVDLPADHAPAHTAAVWLVDREEVGSTGTTGARSRFLELVVAWLLRAQDVRVTEAAMHRAMAASQALSADTPAAINPDWPEVHEAKNAPIIGNGPALFPFTGYGGKQGGSAARAGLIASVRAAFDRAGAALQYGELGRVDEGGGGTIAKYMADRGIDTVDVGIAVVSMHSPMELSAKADVWAAYRGFATWLAE